MGTLRIDADFNGLELVAESPARYAVALDTLGTIRDLSNAGVRLAEGLPLVVWADSDENEDLEGDAVARFDRASGVWWADLTLEGYRYVPKGNRGSDLGFLCLTCRRDLALGTGARGSVPRKEVCPHCGVDIRAAIAPPGA